MNSTDNTPTSSTAAYPARPDMITVTMWDRQADAQVLWSTCLDVVEYAIAAHRTALDCGKPSSRDALVALAARTEQNAVGAELLGNDADKFWTTVTDEQRRELVAAQNARATESGRAFLIVLGVEHATERLTPKDFVQLARFAHALAVR